VVATPPLVDVKQSARGFSVRQDQLQYLPRGVDYTSVVQLLPGTNVESRLGGVSVDGASAAENRFFIDGIDTSSPVLGLPSQFVNVEDVEEVQVKSSGYSAEYGGTTGGVVNVLTKSGTNAWHGELRFALNDDVLDAGPRPELRRKLTVVNEAEYITYAEDPYVTLEPGFSVGGPIRRNLAWFFAGYQPIRHAPRANRDVRARPGHADLRPGRRAPPVHRKPDAAARRTPAHARIAERRAHHHAWRPAGEGRDRLAHQFVRRRYHRAELDAVGQRRRARRAHRVPVGARGLHAA
jgi:hypothetical protein